MAAFPIAAPDIVQDSMQTLLACDKGPLCAVSTDYFMPIHSFQYPSDHSM